MIEIIKDLGDTLKLKRGDLKFEALGVRGYGPGIIEVNGVFFGMYDLLYNRKGFSLKANRTLSSIEAIDEQIKALEEAKDLIRELDENQDKFLPLK